MADIIQLKRASFDSVEFPFEETTTTGGNRLVKFNYPGSDKQAIEVQGKAPRSYSMNIIIPHKFGDKTYYQLKEDLLRVLENKKRAILIHPTDGEVNNVIPGIYTLTERISSLGRGKISVTFEVDDAPGIPQQSDKLASQVQKQSDLLNAQLNTDLADNYDVSLNFSGNFSDALENVGNVATAFESATGLATPIPDLAQGFNRALGVFSQKVGDLVQDPASLAESIAGLFEQTNSLYDSPEATSRAVKGLFAFGDDDPIVRNNTVGRTQRNQNRGILRANIKAQSLSYGYLNAVQSDYTTTDDLNLAQDDLEKQYLDIRNNELISNDSLEQLDRLRVDAQNALDEVAVNTRTIVTVETNTVPLSVFAYQHYGNTDLVDTLAELNNIEQNAFVSGEVKVLSV